MHLEMLNRSTIQQNEETDSDSVLFSIAPLLAAGIVAAAGSAASAGVNAASASATSRKSYKFTKMLQEQQYERQKEMRDYANWYNSPVEQRARYEAAGLNPDLMYGGGSTSAGMSETPSVSNNQFHAESPGNIGGLVQRGIDQFWNGIYQQNIVDKIQMENKLLAQRAINEAETSRLIRAQADAQLKTNNFLDEKLQLGNEKLAGEVLNTGLTSGVINSQTDLNNMTVRQMSQKMVIDQQDLLLRIRQMNINEKKLEADMKMIDQMVLESSERVKNLTPERKRLYMEATKAEVLNYYYFNRGKLPSNNVWIQIIDRMRNMFSDGVW
jgi:hypothetical protein